MYSATETRQIEKEGRTLTYFSVTRGREFFGMMVRVKTMREEGEPLVYWYVESELSDPDKEPCTDVNECFKKTLKAWKRRKAGR